MNSNFIDNSSCFSRFLLTPNVGDVLNAGMQHILIVSSTFFRINVPLIFRDILSCLVCFLFPYLLALYLTHYFQLLNAMLWLRIFGIEYSLRSLSSSIVLKKDFEIAFSPPFPTFSSFLTHLCLSTSLPSASLPSPSLPSHLIHILSRRDYVPGDKDSCGSDGNVYDFMSLLSRFQPQLWLF